MRERERERENERMRERQREGPAVNNEWAMRGEYS